MPASIKNAIDVVARPVSEGHMKGKLSLIVTHSTGNVSGFGAKHHLCQSLVFLDVPVLAQLEVCSAQDHTLFDDDNQLTNEGTKTFLKTVVDTYLDFASRFVKY